MKTATVREVQHGLSGILDRVEQGEEIVVTRRGKVVAQIVPPKPPPSSPAKWPDFEARLRERFPDGPPSGQPASEIIDQQRGERL